MTFSATLQEGSSFLHVKFGNSNPIFKEVIQGHHGIIPFWALTIK
jgi:hypothetical protein